MKKQILTVLFAVSCSYVAMAQAEINTNEITFKNGEFLGISIPLKDLPAADENGESTHNEGDVKENRKRPEEVNANALPESEDPIRQKSFGMIPTKAAIVSWDGQNGQFPPDPSGAAGPNHYVQAVNTKYRVYDKNGLGLTTSLNLSSLWPGSTNDGDPIVMYDRHADRWVITQFQVSGKKILFAVSTTPDPIGTYYTYSFTFTQFPDYPKYSIWSDGYYMTSNSGNKNAVAFDRTKMLAGDPTASMVALNLPSMATGYGFKSVLPADADGTLPPYGTPNYMFYFQDDSWAGVNIDDHIKILKMQVDWVTPLNSTITVHQTIFTTAFNSNFTNSWDDIIQKNSTQKLDAMASIFNYRAQYMRWSGYNSVMLCNVVDINNNNLGGIRWYELRQDEATAQFSIYQEGTYAPADGNSRFMGSIAMDNEKHIGLGFNISGTTSFPSIGFTGRYHWHAINEMTLQEQIAIAGLSSQSGGNRFGDYSHMTLDPDGKTFWFTGEYIGASGARKTRIFSFSMQDILGAPQNLLEQAEMLVYQNGADLNIVINNFSSQADFTIELFEMNGRTVRSSKQTTSNGAIAHTFNVDDLPSATYIVRIGNSDIQRIQKIVIQ